MRFKKKSGNLTKSSRTRKCMNENNDEQKKKEKKKKFSSIN